MGKNKIGLVHIDVIPELKTGKAQKELDKLTKPREVEITPKINAMAVFKDMQKILDKSTKSINDALDFKGLADDMQKYINEISKTVDKSLAPSFQAILDDFQERFNNLSFKNKNGELVKGLNEALLEVNKLNDANKGDLKK